MDEINNILDQVFGGQHEAEKTLTVAATITTVSASSSPNTLAPYELRIPKFCADYFRRIPANPVHQPDADALERPLAVDNAQLPDGRWVAFTIEEWLKREADWYTASNDLDRNLYRVSFHRRHDKIATRTYVYRLHISTAEAFKRAAAWYHVKGYPVNLSVPSSGGALRQPAMD